MSDRVQHQRIIMLPFHFLFFIESVYVKNISPWKSFGQGVRTLQVPGVGQHVFIEGQIKIGLDQFVVRVLKGYVDQ